MDSGMMEKLRKKPGVERSTPEHDPPTWLIYAFQEPNPPNGKRSPRCRKKISKRHWQTLELLIGVKVNG